MVQSNILIPISKPIIGDTEKTSVLGVLESGMLAQGIKVAELEERFAVMVGTNHAIAVTSGTAGLHLALLANGVGPDDEVITTPFTFIATVNSILMTGARPVFVDINSENFNIASDLIEQVITSRTKAILPVHLYGQMCDMESIKSIASRYQLAIIEDSCQSVGASINGKKAGSYGTGVFSLYATKNIMSGEGGIITTNDDGIAELCRKMRNHGMSERYYHEMLGFNYRMSDIHAAIGLAQISRLDEFNEIRKENAEYLNATIVSVITPKVQENYNHVWHQYTIRMNNGRDRNDAVRRLNEAGIGTGVFYPNPAHKHKYIQDIVGKDSLPVAELVANQVISLPVHPSLKREELDQIVEAVNKL